jgi:hypothetical protein
MHGTRVAMLRRVVPLAVLAIAAWTYLTYGFQNAVDRDDAFYAYCGQQVAAGHAPYERVFDVKGPLASAFPAAGVVAANYFGVPEHLGVRTQFVIIAIATALGVYLLGQALTGSVIAGAFSAFAFIGFEGFIWHAAGARPKMAAVAVMTFALLFVVRRRWALAGALIATAVLTWQTTAVLGLAALGSIWGREGERRLRAALTLVGSGLAVVALVVSWAAIEGALTQLWDASVVSLVFLAGRSKEETIGWLLWRPLTRAYDGYPGTFMAGCLGVVGMVAAFAGIMRDQDGPVGAFLRSPWSPLLASFIFFAGFSVLDFQRYDDAFIMLPFLAVGFGFILERALRALTGPNRLIRPGQRQVAAAMVALAILAPTIVHVKWNPGEGLQEQQRIINEVVTRLGDAPIQCINAPTVLFLGELDNATRHVVLSPPLLDYMDAVEAGGVDGWLASIKQSDVELIVCNPQDMPGIERWVENNYRVWREYPAWTVYEREQQQYSAER